MKYTTLVTSMCLTTLCTVYTPLVSAEIIKYQIVGTVSEIDAPLQGGQVSVGDTVNGHFYAETIANFDSGNNDLAIYDTNDLLLNIGDNYEVTAPVGNIRVFNNYAGSSIDQVLIDFTSGQGLVGPAVNSSWLPDYYHQKFAGNLTSSQLPLEMDVNANGNRSQLRFNVDDSVQFSFSVSKLSVIADDPAPPLPNVYFRMDTLADINGNGFPELAFLRTVPSGNVHVLIRDSINREYIKTMTFFNANHEPLDITTLPDADGNGYPEIAVMALDITSGQTRTVVKDAVTEEQLSGFIFSP